MSKLDTPQAQKDFLGDCGETSFVIDVVYDIYAVLRYHSGCSYVQVLIQGGTNVCFVLEN